MNSVYDNYYEDFEKEEVKEEVNGLFQYEENRQKTEYKEVPAGTYIVEITSLSVGLTKANKPALKAKFTITDGSYIHSNLFMTTVLTSDFTVNKAMEFLDALGTKEKINFGDSDKFAILTEKIFAAIKGNCEYDLKYWMNSKGFKEFKIEGIYDLI
jgi:hypothetical protein